MKKSIHSPENKQVVRLLKQIREDRGLTQMQLAESLGVTQSFVSKIERGERVVDVIQLREICLCLGTTLTKFVIQLERQFLKPL